MQYIHVQRLLLTDMRKAMMQLMTSRLVLKSATYDVLNAVLGVT